VLTTTLVIGVVVSILLTEITALSAGGIVVPGYVALILDQPVQLAVLLMLVTLTFGIVRAASAVLMLYGARRFGVTVLVGLALSAGAQQVRVQADPVVFEWAGLGYIVPGLIAHQWDRQGVLPTLLMIAIAAPIVRLIALLVVQW
jgi:poly-gamma-glutamate biosynthesis protein PgsC/CapC